jgi:hypothetical protein
MVACVPSQGYTRSHRCLSTTWQFMADDLPVPRGVSVASCLHLSYVVGCPSPFCRSTSMALCCAAIIQDEIQDYKSVSSSTDETMWLGLSAESLTFSAVPPASSSRYGPVAMNSLDVQCPSMAFPQVHSTLDPLLSIFSLPWFALWLRLFT